MDALGLLVVAGIMIYLASRLSSEGQASPFMPNGVTPSSGGTPPPAGTPTSNVIQKLAQAIAQAEGFYVAGSIPQRQNNPGDLAPGGAIATYPTPADGWAALYDQVQAMFDGRSAYYNPSMTLAQVGVKYAGGDPNWSSNVAAALGVSTDTTLSQLAQLM